MHDRYPRRGARIRADPLSKRHQLGHRSQQAGLRPGFTLVELLVVIAIIGVLGQPAPSRRAGGSRSRAAHAVRK
jgi:prepilin-type N-terminal cleavage/methylation domain-containing protein